MQNENIQQPQPQVPGAQTQSDGRPLFELSEDAMKKLGVDQNLQEIAENTSSQLGKKKTDKKAEQAGGGASKKTNADTGEGSETSTDAPSTGGEEPRTEQSSSQAQYDTGTTTNEGDDTKTRDTGDGDDDGDFDTELSDFVKTLDTPEKRRDFIKKAKEGASFTAENTKRAQKLAEERRELEATVKRLQVPEFQEAAQALLKVPDLDDLLESADKWYKADGLDNPLRPIVEALRGMYDSESGTLTEYASSQSESQQAEVNTMLEQELSSIQTEFEEFKDEKKVQELAAFIDEFNQKHSDEMVFPLGFRTGKLVHDAKVKLPELQKKLDKVSAELKERNKELTHIKKHGVLPGHGVLGSSGSGYASLEFSTPAHGFDDAEQRAKKRLGVE